MADLVNGACLCAFADSDVARLALQARAGAVRAGLGAAVARQVFAHQAGIGLAVAPLHVGDDAFERVLLAELLALGKARVHHVVELDFFLAGSLQHRLLHVGAERLKGLLDVELVVLGQAFQQCKVIAVAPVPALDGATGQAQRGEGHDPARVEKLLRTESVTGRAGTDRRVEREQTRLQLGNRVAAHRAGELGVEQMFLLVLDFKRDGAATGQAQRGFKAFGQALLDFRAHLEAVDDDVDVVLLGFFQLRQLVELEGLAIDAKAHIALRLHVGKDVEELAFLLACHRRQDHQARIKRQRQHRVHHLAHGLRLQRQVVLGAKRCAGAREQQSQVIVDLGHGAHGGARVVRGGFLLDRDRR